MGYIQKALEKGYLEHPGSTCCTDDMFEIFVRFGRCLWCLLPPFVNRQLPCPHTNSLHGLLRPRMHRKSLWCVKGLALGVQSGCRWLGTGLETRQKSPVQSVHSNLHARMRRTEIWHHPCQFSIQLFVSLLFAWSFLLPIGILPPPSCLSRLASLAVSCSCGGCIPFMRLAFLTLLFSTALCFHGCGTSCGGYRTKFRHGGLI